MYVDMNADDGLDPGVLVYFFGVFVYIFTCLEKAMKNRWGYIFVVSALAAGLSGCIDSSESSTDLCLDDPEKTSPGVCGCGVADIDTDGDSVLDCEDLCPEDPNKTVPLQCGCGVAEVDLDNNTIPDCLDETSDLCPEDPDKTRPGICGCGVLDADTDGDTIPDCRDYCPEDPAKTTPGTCGCGIEDSDLDNNTIPDCLGENIDLCPEDPAKTLPGVCGCGVADEDTDGDTLPDCLDACPEDSEKTRPGLCGCGVADSSENITDSDGDGVINCLDYCPNEKTKHEKPVGDVEVAAYCALPDTDGDGYDDPDDACPTDPNIHEWPEDGSLPNCGNYSEESRVFTITKAKDLDDLKVRLSEVYQNVACEEGNVACSGTNKLDCTKIAELNQNVYRTIECTSCEVGEDGTVSATCANNVQLAFEEPYLKIEMAQDIDLSDYLTTEVSSDGHCFSKEFESIPTVFNIAWNGNGHTIRYTYNGIRCALPAPLFGQIISSTFEDTTLDIDVEGKTASGLLANTINSSSLSQMTVSGSLTKTGTTQYAGGISGQLTQGYPEPTQIKDVAVKNISVYAGLVSHVGGMFGYIHTKSNTGYDIDLSHVEQDVREIRGTSYVGGLFGYVSGSSSSESPIHLQHIKGRVESVYGSSNYIGGMTGYATYNVDIQDITWTTDDVYGVSYIGGLAGYFASSPKLTGAIVNVDSVKSKSSNTGGLIGTSHGTNSDIDLRVKHVEGTYNTGGLIGTDEDGSISNVSLAFGEVIGTNSVGGAIGYANSSKDSQRMAIRGNLVKGTETEIGGVVGYTIHRTWKDIVSYVNEVQGELNNIGGFAGRVYNFDGAKLLIDNANIRTMIINSELTNAGGLIGFISHPSTSSPAPTLNNVAVQANLKINGSLPYYGGLIGQISQAATMKLTNIVSTTSRYIKEASTVAGMLIGSAYASMTWTNSANVYYYTYGSTSETTVASGTQMVIAKKFAETASTGVESMSNVVTALGDGWSIGTFELDGKNVMVPVLQIEGMTLPEPFE